MSDNGLGLFDPQVLAMAYPDMAAQKAAIDWRSQMAQAMLKQGMSPMTPPNTAAAGGVAIKTSPMEGLAHLFQTGMGSYFSNQAMQDAAKHYRDLGVRMQADASGVPDGNTGALPPTGSNGSNLAAPTPQQLASAITGGNDPLASVANNPPPGGPTPAARNALGLGGVPPKVLATWISLHPEVALKAYYEGLKPTDKQKDARFATEQKTPAAQLVEAQLNHDAGTVAPAAPGTQQVRGADGNLVAKPVPGAADAVAAAAGAKAAAEKAGAASGEGPATLAQEAEAARRANRTLNQLELAVKGFTPGASAAGWASLSKMAQAMGMSAESANSYLGNAASYEEAQKLTMELLTDRMKSMGSKSTQGEFNAILQHGLPNGSLTPGGLSSIINDMRNHNREALDKQAAYIDEKPGDYTMWEHMYNQRVAQKQQSDHEAAMSALNAPKPQLEGVASQTSTMQKSVPAPQRPDVTAVPRPQGMSDAELIKRANASIASGRDRAGVEAQLRAWGVKF